MKVKEIDSIILRGPSMLLYSPIGIGKTGFVSQAGDRGFCFDCDDGLRTAKHLVDKFSDARMELEFETFFDTGRGTVFYPKAKKLLIDMHNQIAKKVIEQKEIYILDSMTGLVKLVKNLVKSASKHPDRNPSQEEWGIIINEVENFMALFRALPGVKIVTGHDNPIEDADGIVRYKFACPGKKLPTDILGLFDDVFYGQVVNRAGGVKERVLTSQSTAAIEVRTRSDFKGSWPFDSGLIELLTKLKYPIKEVLS